MWAAMTVACGMYMSRSINANDINSKASDSFGDDLDGLVWYDIAFYAGMDPRGGKAWTDSEQAAKYILELQDQDEDTLMKGTRWTVLYSLNAFSTIFICINTAILGIGAYQLKARILGMACCPLIGCLQIACIITTAVFRFNTMGKLAALSLTPSAYDENSPQTGYLGDSRTFNMDASWILWLWLMQLMMCV